MFKNIHIELLVNPPSVEMRYLFSRPALSFQCLAAGFDQAEVHHGFHPYCYVGISPTYTEPTNRRVHLGFMFVWNIDDSYTKFVVNSTSIHRDRSSIIRLHQPKYAFLPLTISDTSQQISIILQINQNLVPICSNSQLGTRGSSTGRRHFHKLSDRLRQCDDRHHVPTWQTAI